MTRTLGPGTQIAAECTNDTPLYTAGNLLEGGHHATDLTGERLDVIDGSPLRGFVDV
jgi:hypothetical protein